MLAAHVCKQDDRLSRHAVLVCTPKSAFPNQTCHGAASWMVSPIDQLPHSACDNVKAGGTASTDVEPCEIIPGTAKQPRVVEPDQHANNWREKSATDTVHRVQTALCATAKSMPALARFLVCLFVLASLHTGEPAGKSYAMCSSCTHQGVGSTHNMHPRLLLTSSLAT